MATLAGTAHTRAQHPTTYLHRGSAALAAQTMGRRRRRTVVTVGATGSKQVTQVAELSTTNTNAAKDCKLYPYSTLQEYSQVEGMLHSIFCFKHNPAPRQQSTHATAWYRDLVVKFMGALQALSHSPTTSTPATPWPDLSACDLAALSAAAGILKQGNIMWLPNFGCAIIGLASPTAVRLGELSLHLVALDGWEYALHSFPAGIDHTAAPGSHTCGATCSIPADKYSSFTATVDIMVATRQVLKAKKNVKGFQRSPAFIEAVMQDAVQCVMKFGGDVEAFQEAVGFRDPKGGFTDVGEHTGSKPRDTSWPLVSQMTLAVLTHCGCCTASQQPDLLFKQAMLHLELWLLLGLSPLITPDTATSKVLDNCCTMLRSVATKAAALAADGRDVSAVEAACRAVQQQLCTAASQQQRRLAEQLLLPAAGCAAGSSGLLGSWGPPEGIIPAELPVRFAKDGLEASRQRAARNLDSLPIITGSQPLSAALQQLQALLQQALSSTPQPPAAATEGQQDSGSSAATAAAGWDTVAQLALRSVEAELFGRAVAGLDGPGGYGYAKLTESQVKQLWQIVDQYRLVLHAFKQTSAGQAVMQVEQRSRELLVVLIAYCITFEAARHQYAVLGSSYGVAIQYEDLRHLVLSDRAAVDAALAAGSYLQRHTVPNRPLFSLRDKGSATFDLAQQFAAQDRSMSSTWQQEDAAARARVQQHWEQVRDQQCKARRLRSRLSTLRSDESSLQSRLLYADYYSGERTRISRNLSSTQEEIYQVQKQLSAAERPPPPVFQPLPESRSRALRWIFFLYMPSNLRHLSAGSFLVQQLLLPLPLDSYPEVADAVAVDGLITDLTSYYNNHKPSSTGSQGLVQLFSEAKVPSADEVNRTHIDQFYNEKDGVWYPDQLMPSMAWEGSGSAADSLLGIGGSFINPFRPIADTPLVDSFTEQLKHDSSSLQWAMPQYYSSDTIAADRGNLGIAQQDEESKPSWLSKPAYLGFARLRSYPLRQLHRLCELLNDGSLPLEHHTVHVLVRQTLYHLGPLVTSSGSNSSSAGSAGQLSLLWHTEWDSSGGILQALCFELTKLAEQLEETPRGHDAVLLLGEMAAFLADWHAPCKALARRFAAMTARAADALQGAIEAAAGDEDVQAKLMAKQCTSRMMALLCYNAGGLQVEDAAHMVRLMVQIKHGDVYLGTAGAEYGLAALRVLCHNTMCRRLREVNSLLHSCGNSSSRAELLTAAVSTVLQRVPDFLAWKQLKTSTWSGQDFASYEAVGVDDKGQQHLYSINVLDGTVLLDGAPPGRLPREVLTHPLYVRTFAGVDFEVVTTEQGVLQTIRPVKGRFYDFYLAAGPAATGAAPGAQASGTQQWQQQLVITEVDRQAGERLELLDPGSGDACGLWGGQLPVRLRELHSHWLSRWDPYVLLCNKFNSALVVSDKEPVVAVAL